MADVQIIFPSQNWGSLEEGLSDLTKAISKINPELLAHGFLGGLFGYGAIWENAVFMMHPYCWCEDENCPWCGGCRCSESTFHYFWDEKEVVHQFEIRRG